MQRPTPTIIIGSHDFKGRQPTMEDTHIYSEREINGHKIVCAGIFDGHGCKDTAIYLEEHFTEVFYRYLNLNNVNNSIKEVFAVIDNELRDKDVEGGSTAVIIVVIDDKLYSANIGDSEAYLIKRDNKDLNMTNLSYKHKGSDQSEISRILELGGEIFSGRVFGTLAVTRAFGDFSYKIPRRSTDYVISTPYQYNVQLDKSCKYIILASDGFWDFCSLQDASALIDTFFDTGQTPDEIAKFLVYYAYNNASIDNITIQVIKMDWN
jgi:serine/threonine protein phosphatase PrpC